MKQMIITLFIIVISGIASARIDLSDSSQVDGLKQIEMPAAVGTQFQVTKELRFAAGKKTPIPLGGFSITHCSAIADSYSFSVRVIPDGTLVTLEAIEEQTTERSTMFLTKDPYSFYDSYGFTDTSKYRFKMTYTDQEGEKENFFVDCIHSNESIAYINRNRGSVNRVLYKGNMSLQDFWLGNSGFLTPVYLPGESQK